jgi:glycosyltransferase involved in cell wall biosynthesis
VNGVKVRRLNNVYTLHQRLLGIRGVHRAIGLVFGPDRSRMLTLSPWSLRAFLMTLSANADVVSVFNWYHGSLVHQTAVARALRGFAFVGVPLLHTERPWARTPLLANLLTQCDAVATMTEHEQQFVESRAPRVKTHVVGAGVDPALFAAADGAAVRARYGLAGSPVVGYVGRMSGTKGVAMLLEAMKIVWRQDPAVRLLLAGSGLAAATSGDQEIDAAFAALSEAERARVISVSALTDEDKASLFDAFDVFAMPSVAESFGITYLEAWMRAKPVIGSRIGATECVIRDGVDGFLTPPGAPADLAALIIRLLSDRQLRERMGKAGQEKVLARFTWDKVADRIETVYLNARAAHESGARADRAVA